MEKQENERHTEDMQEIITKVPSWIVRNGMVLFFCILFMMLFITVFVRYPDTIKANLKFESSGIITPIVSDNPALVTKLWVKQGDNIKKGQQLISLKTITSNLDYMLYASEDGRVNFITYLEEGEILKPHQQLFSIHPAGLKYYGIVEIPTSQINKIKLSQKVLINLDNYSSNELRQIEGKVSFIADEPSKNGYFIIKVTLNDLSINRKINNWVIAQAAIITQNESLFRRIFDSIFKGLGN